MGPAAPAAQRLRDLKSARPSPTLGAMQKPKAYKCSICGAGMSDLPMPVLKHQLSHVRRPLARNQPLPPANDQPEEKKAADR